MKKGFRMYNCEPTG